MPELMARVRVQLRRGDAEDMPEGALRVGDLAIDRATPRGDGGRDAGSPDAEGV